MREHSAWCLLCRVGSRRRVAAWRAHSPPVYHVKEEEVLMEGSSGITAAEADGEVTEPAAELADASAHAPVDDAADVPVGGERGLPKDGATPPAATDAGSSCGPSWTT